MFVTCNILYDYYCLRKALILSKQSQEQLAEYDQELF